MRVHTHLGPEAPQQYQTVADAPTVAEAQSVKIVVGLLARTIQRNTQAMRDALGILQDRAAEQQRQSADTESVDVRGIRRAFRELSRLDTKKTKAYAAMTALEDFFV